MSKPLEEKSDAVATELSLLSISKELSLTIKIFQEINNRGNIISLNASIEGAKMRSKFPSFAIVATQIQSQSLKNNELMERLQDLVEKIKNVSLRATATRYYELAEDLIDKLDRNLFERNCDAQAWATFETIINCTQIHKDKNKEALRDEFKNEEESIKKANQVLEKLVDTYMVYTDVFVVNNTGNIVACGKEKKLIGNPCSEFEWFKLAMKGEVNVSEMSKCPLLKKNTVMYTAPIFNAAKEIIGVVSTRFNWNFAQEMIDSFNIDLNSKAYLIDNHVVVIGATDGLGVMRDGLDWLTGARSTLKGHCGFSLEKDRNGDHIAVGYALSKGYNSYRGKKWSAVVTSKIDAIDYDNFLFSIEQRTYGMPSTKIRENNYIESELANFALNDTMKQVEDLVQMININNRAAKFLAINSAIQSGIAGMDGDGFAILASEIGGLAKKSLEFVQKVNNIANKLKKVVGETVNKRLLDAAQDAMDKVDRNLFERYGDIQAWTTFQLFLDVLENQSKREEACTLAAQLHQIYEVYSEVILLDTKGVIVCSAKDSSLIGTNQGNREWFREAAKGKVFFTDVYHSKTTNRPTISFSAPICNDQGEVMGVLSTKFNCNFLNDILKVVIADSKSRVSLINSEGLVIASVDPKDVLVKKFPISVLEKIRFGKNGLCDIKDNVSDLKIGFAWGKGYNSYPGKSWAMLIERPNHHVESVVEINKSKVTEPAPKKVA